MQTTQTEIGLPDESRNTPSEQDAKTFPCPVCEKPIRRAAYPSTREFPCPHCDSLVATPSLGIGAGTVLDDFTLIRRIGHGSMGEVYLAFQRSLSRNVAIKLLSPALTAVPEQIERFRAEVQYLARLRHPNIVTAFYAGSFKETHYLAMTYVDGESLQHYSDRIGPLPEEEALSVEFHVALALRYAWEEHGFLHRDIKPANIMLDENGEIRLTDLGISKFVYEETSEAHGHRILGTPHYMSPEQARGELHIDFRSDMYSLGATFYHLLAGHPPFDGQSIKTVIKCQIRETPPAIHTLRPDCSRASVKILNRLLSKNPNDRYDSWDALLHAVAHALKKESGYDLAAIQKFSDEAIAPTTNRHKRRSTFRITLLLAGIALAGMAWWYVSEDKQTAEPSTALMADTSTDGDSVPEVGPALNTHIHRGVEYLENLYRNMADARAERVRQDRVAEVLDHLDQKARTYLLAGLPDHAAAVYIDYAGPWAEESWAERHERAEIFARRGLMGPPAPADR